ncbi:MAG: glycosyltransferase family 52 protein [Lachnospiraceae bacterium]|nr:glycosyltransferase family 52 protein [Lachnospiraceae bacterium]MDE7182872.1 glycosyltransferase family 52 protein [Lachnospiraceae bacterium]
MKQAKTKSRIYICHTFYHVYVAVLKEMKLVRETSKTVYQKADIALSSVSTDFEHLGDRLAKTGIFQNVIALDEKREDFFPELAKYRKNYSNILKHMINRMIFTKKLAKCERPYMEVIDFAAYEDIYVFCDSDPVGYYLNYKHLYYHAVEDGLDCLKNLDDAYVANHGHFRLKTWFSRHNLIFIMNGWGKYCLDMEINDRSVVPTDCPRFVEVPRKPLERALTPEQKKLMIQAFIEDADALAQQLKPSREGEAFACFLTEPHPVDVEARKRVCLDVIAQYCQGCRVLIKPHPRDTIDYEALCPDAVVLRGRFPVEVLNFFEGLHIKRAVSIVTTAMNNMDFVEEKLNLGASFWDAYEDPEKHAYNKKAGLALADQ